jgi:hypothetical protein
MKSSLSFFGCLSSTRPINGFLKVRRGRFYQLALSLIFASGFVARIPAAQLDSWHWRNPTPFANELRSICFGAQKFVSVGDGGIIHTSPDGSTWDDGRRITSSALHKVIYANGQFIAVGDKGVILTSTNGYAWNAQSSGTTNGLFSVAFVNGKYVACGLGGQLAVSSDGSTWSPGKISTSDLYWITAGNGVFVLPAPGVISPQGTLTVRVSPDGLNWTTATFPPSMEDRYNYVINEATFGNGVFVASVFCTWPYSRFFTSPDGTNWTAGTILGISNPPNFLSSANDLFLDFFGQSAGVSTDGMSPPYASWIQVPPEAGNARDLTFGNGNYVLLGSGGALWTSTDLTNWVAAYGKARLTIQQMLRGSNNYLAAASTQLLASADGLSFSPLPGSPSLCYGGVGFDGSNYVAVGASGAVYTSSNGTVWVQRTSNTGANLAAVCRGLTRWVAVGASGTVISSPTSTAWTLRFSGTANDLKAVAFGNGTYVAVGHGGTIISSSDGATWDVQDSGTVADLNGLAFLSGQFFALGTNGTLLSSADGMSWQSQNSHVSRDLYSMTFGNGQYVACGYDVDIPGYALSPTPNVLVASADGINWQDITTKVPANVALVNAAYLDGSFWLSGGNGAILQSDSSDGIPHLLGALSPDRSDFQLKVTLNCPPTYRVQIKTNLTTGWQDTATVTNPVSPYIWTDTNGIGSPIRLYRIASP